MAKSSVGLYRSLFEQLEPETVRLRFLLALVKLQNVRRGSIWEKQEDEYVCVEAVGDEEKRIKGTAIDARINSIVGWVIENRKMTVAEPGKDSRHYAAFESDMLEKSTLILCFPLFLESGKAFGAVQIIDVSPHGKAARVDQEYLELLQSIVDIGSIALRNSLKYTRELDEKKRLKETLDQLRSQEIPILGGPTLVKALETARSYANTSLPVLLTGESGTGKERVASMIHQWSPRKKGPFLVQNCSAIPDTLLESELFGYRKGAFTGANADKIGLFEASNGGTVFLDEIGDMPMTLQARILRFTQDGEVRPLGTTKAKKTDARIIAATNKDLKQSVQEKMFRGDLFYRLSVLPLHLPPLRERREDVPLLCGHFLKRESALLDIPPKHIQTQAMSVLSSYAWPGNVRELENLVRYLLVVAKGEEITVQDLPEDVRKGNEPEVAETTRDAGRDAESTSPPAPSPNSCTWDEMERRYVTYLLEKHRWSVTAAADEAGINRSTFNSRMRKLGIKR